MFARNLIYKIIDWRRHRNSSIVDDLQDQLIRRSLYRCAHTRNHVILPFRVKLQEGILDCYVVSRKIARLGSKCDP